MPENSQPRLKTVLRSDVLTGQGLRLTSAFLQLRDIHDREQVIALAEQLLAAQNATSQ
jgi:hypothetical protein